MSRLQRFIWAFLLLPLMVLPKTVFASGNNNRIDVNDLMVAVIWNSSIELTETSIPVDYNSGENESTGFPDPREDFQAIGASALKMFLTALDSRVGYDPNNTLDYSGIRLEVRDNKGVMEDNDGVLPNVRIYRSLSNITYETIESDFGGRTPGAIVYINAGSQWFEDESDLKNVLTEASRSGVGIFSIGSDATTDAMNIDPDGDIFAVRGIQRPMTFEAYANERYVLAAFDFYKGNPDNPDTVILRPGTPQTMTLVENVRYDVAQRRYFYDDVKDIYIEGVLDELHEDVTINTANDEWQITARAVNVIQQDIYMPDMNIGVAHRTTWLEFDGNDIRVAAETSNNNRPVWLNGELVFARNQNLGLEKDVDFKVENDVAVILRDIFVETSDGQRHLFMEKDDRVSRRNGWSGGKWHKYKAGGFEKLTIDIDPRQEVLVGEGTRTDENPELFSHLFPTLYGNGSNLRSSLSFKDWSTNGRITANADIWAIDARKGEDNIRPFNEIYTTGFDPDKYYYAVLGNQVAFDGRDGGQHYYSEPMSGYFEKHPFKRLGSSNPEPTAGPARNNGEVGTEEKFYHAIAAIQRGVQRIVMMGFQPQYINETDVILGMLQDALIWIAADNIYHPTPQITPIDSEGNLVNSSGDVFHVYTDVRSLQFTLDYTQKGEEIRENPYTLYYEIEYNGDLFSGNKFIDNPLDFRVIRTHSVAFESLGNWSIDLNGPQEINVKSWVEPGEPKRWFYRSNDGSAELSLRKLANPAVDPPSGASIRRGDDLDFDERGQVGDDSRVGNVGFQLLEPVELSLEGDIYTVPDDVIGTDFTVKVQAVHKDERFLNSNPVKFNYTLIGDLAIVNVANSNEFFGDEIRLRVESDNLSTATKVTINSNDGFSKEVNLNEEFDWKPSNDVIEVVAEAAGGIKSERTFKRRFLPEARITPDSEAVKSGKYFAYEDSTFNIVLNDSIKVEDQLTLIENFTSDSSDIYEVRYHTDLSDQRTGRDFLVKRDHVDARIASASNNHRFWIGSFEAKPVGDNRFAWATRKSDYSQEFAFRRVAVNFENPNVDTESVTLRVSVKDDIWDYTLSDAEVTISYRSIEYPEGRDVVLNFENFRSDVYELELAKGFIIESVKAIRSGYRAGFADLSNRTVRYLADPQLTLTKTPDYADPYTGQFGDSLGFTISSVSDTIPEYSVNSNDFNHVEENLIVKGDISVRKIRAKVAETDFYSADEKELEVRHRALDTPEFTPASSNLDSDYLFFRGAVIKLGGMGDIPSEDYSLHINGEERDEFIATLDYVDELISNGAKYFELTREARSTDIFKWSNSPVENNRYEFRQIELRLDRSDWSVEKANFVTVVTAHDPVTGEELTDAVISFTYNDTTGVVSSGDEITLPNGGILGVEATRTGYIPRKNDRLGLFTLEGEIDIDIDTKDTYTGGGVTITIGSNFNDITIRVVQIVDGEEIEIENIETDIDGEFILVIPGDRIVDKDSEIRVVVEGKDVVVGGDVLIEGEREEERVSLEKHTLVSITATDLVTGREIGSSGDFEEGAVVTLSNPDANVSTIEYRIDGGDWQIYTEPFTLTNDAKVEARITSDSKFDSDISQREFRRVVSGADRGSAYYDLNANGIVNHAIIELKSRWQGLALPTRVECRLPGVDTSVDGLNIRWEDADDLENSRILVDVPFSTINTGFASGAHITLHGERYRGDVEVENRVAPVVKSASWTFGFMGYEDERDPDTLVVTFSEPVSPLSVGSAPVELFRMGFAGDYEYTVFVKDGGASSDNKTYRFVVDRLHGERSNPGRDDSLWINVAPEDLSIPVVTDLSGNSQLNPENRKVEARPGVVPYNVRMQTHWIKDNPKFPKDFLSDMGSGRFSMNDGDLGGVVILDPQIDFTPEEMANVRVNLSIVDVVGNAVANYSGRAGIRGSVEMRSVRMSFVNRQGRLVDRNVIVLAWTGQNSGGRDVATGSYKVIAEASWPDDKRSESFGVISVSKKY